MTDPWATASTSTQATPAARNDSFTSPANRANPFATSASYRGEYTPSPTLEALQGRLVVLVARTFDAAAKDPNNPGQTRECYTTDLYVLDGGPFSFSYTVKGDPEKGTPDEIKDMSIPDVSPATPFECKGFWVPQGALIGKLKQAHRDGIPFLGIPAIGPVKVDRDKGKTKAAVQQEVAAWISRGRATARPRYSWFMEEPSVEQVKAAEGWWVEAGSKLEPVNPATAPARA